MKTVHSSPGRLLTAVALGVLALADQAHAQAAAADAPMRVEITGSSIKHVGSEDALPVTTIKAEELQQRGYTTLADVMMGLSQSASLEPSNAGAGTNINLRGLGVNRTLVLLNGRRLANEATADGFADIDNIPMSALDRVEILNDGASSTYGSDAIGGVVNFITKATQQGGSLTAQAVQPWLSGGGEEKRASIIYGKGDLNADGWNLYGTIDAHRRSRLAQADRAFLTSTAKLTAMGHAPSLTTGGYSYPANVYDPKTKTYYNPYYATGCEAPYSIQGGGNTCQLNSNEYGTALYGNQQLTMDGKGTLKLGDAHLLSIEYTRGQEYIDSARNPATSAQITTVTPKTAAAIITTSSPYYPGGSAGVPAIAGINGDPLTVYYSLPQLAETRDTQINQRLVVNDEGTVGGWDYKAGFDYGQSNRDIRLHQGIVNGQLLNTGISNGTLNPFGAQSAAGQTYLDSITYSGDQLLRSARTTFTGIDGTLTRELMSLAGGPLQVALGADLHRDTYRDHKEAVGTYAAPVAAAPTYGSGSRDVAALFAELEAPVTKTLTLNLAVRDDHFNDVGNTVNPKASFRFQPAKSLMFRGSVGTGFRAPTLSDLHGYRAAGANTTMGLAMDDPVLCPGGIAGHPGTGTPVANLPVGDTAATVCNAKLPLQTGSNPDLKPEKSRTFTLGVVMEPVRNATVSLDYWNISMTNMIANLPQSAIVNNPQKYIDLFVYDSTGALLYIKDDTMNLGGQKTDGIDVSGNWLIPTATAGTFTLGLDGTWLHSFLNQLEKDGAWYSNAGQFGYAGNGTTSSLPIMTFRWKHTLHASWAYHDWMTQLTESYDSSYRDQNTTTVAAANNHTIPSYSVVNWTTAYRGFKHFTIVGGISNLFGRMPPPTNNSSYSPYYYVAGEANPIGRAWNGSVTYEF